MRKFGVSRWADLVKRLVCVNGFALPDRHRAGFAVAILGFPALCMGDHKRIAAFGLGAVGGIADDYGHSITGCAEGARAGCKHRDTGFVNAAISCKNPS